MKKKIEKALTKLLVKHQDEDTLIEVVRREAGVGVRLQDDKIVTSKGSFKVRVILED